jgi:hypothetical protein
MISGQHLGGFYLLYVLLALPHGAVHSLFAVSGVVLLCISYNKFRTDKTVLSRNIINLFGLVLLLLSIFFFFHNDKEHYNYGTFYQLIPQITLVIFSVISVSFFLQNFISIFKNQRKDNGILQV